MPKTGPISIQPLASSLGAEVRGVDLKDLSDDDFDRLRQAYLDHGVIFIRDQDLRPEDHIAFAERWAPIEINRFFKPVDGYPQVAQVLKEPEDQLNIGGGWHTDHSYDTAPAMGSLLYALEVPEAGGDTMWASTGAAYDGLSDAFKEVLAPLRAIHSNEHVFGPKASYDVGDRIGNPEAAGQTAVHPVVIAHPETGRSHLYVNPGFTRSIEGFSEVESKALLGFLYEQITRPEFSVRLKWEAGTLAFWDNRATWHWALNDYPGQRRYMQRITVKGSELAAA